MSHLWEEIEFKDGQVTRTGYARGELMIVYALDEELMSWPNHFEIWHRLSREYLLSADVTLDRCMEIGDHLHRLADWSAMSSTDDLLVQARILGFGAGYPEEVLVVNDWTTPDLDELIPYGAQAGHA